MCLSQALELIVLGLYKKVQGENIKVIHTNKIIKQMWGINQIFYALNKKVYLTINQVETNYQYS